MPYSTYSWNAANHGAASVGYLEHGLAMAEALVAHASARSYALGALNPPKLPSPAVPDDQAHLRTLASLYLTSQLELACFLPAVEWLAGVGSGLSMDLGPSSSRLMEFWRHRKERFSAMERQSLYQRLFDSGFEDLMISLCEALYKLDEGVPVPGRSNQLEQARVRAVGQQLAEYLLDHTTGESTFAANDILTTTRVASDILKDPHVQHAFGAHTVWTTVTAILLRSGKTIADPVSLLTRGKAGLSILSWLAEAHGALNSSAQPIVGLDNPVIGAAVDWLQSSLAIEQSKSPESTRAAGAA